MVQELHHTDSRRWNEHVRIQYSVWVYVLDCLFRPLFLEAATENQQESRIARMKHY